MPDPLLCFITHPLAVAAYILGHPRCVRPGVRTSGDAREYRGAPSPPRRDLDQRLVDEHRDRVQIRRVRFKPESLGLQRDRAASRERVKDRRRTTVTRLPNLGAGLLIQGL